MNLETVRYYERRGLLTIPERSDSGYRKLPLGIVGRIRFIKRTQALGITLKKIKDLLSLRVEPGTTCRMVKKQSEAKLADIAAKIRSLQKMKAALQGITDRCSGRGPTSDCPLLDGLDVEEDFA